MSCASPEKELATLPDTASARAEELNRRMAAMTDQLWQLQREIVKSGAVPAKRREIPAADDLRAAVDSLRHTIWLFLLAHPE